jgi:threonine dehydratase
MSCEKSKLAELEPTQVSTLAREACAAMPNYISVTPIVEWQESLPDGSVETIWLKDETEQATGTFKARGASFAVGRLHDEGCDEAVTFTGGSHGPGFAKAVAHYGMRGTVFVPEGMPESVQHYMRELGSDVQVAGHDFSASAAHGREYAAEHGLPVVHPFDDLAVVSGQGTVGLEFQAQVPDLTHVFVPFGGGGLSGGVGSVYESVSASTKVIAAQVEGCDGLSQAMHHGFPVPMNEGDKRFSGLAVRELSPRVFRLGRRVLNSYTVGCPTAAFQAAYDYRERYGVLLKPEAAVSLAAARRAVHNQLRGQKVGAVVTGRSLDPNFGNYLDELADQHGWEGYRIVN